MPPVMQPALDDDYRFPAWGWAAVVGGSLLALVLVCLLVSGFGLLALERGESSASAVPATQPAGMIIATQVLTATVTPDPAQPASAGQFYAEVGGIPLPEGVRAESVVGDEHSFSVITQQPIGRVIAFYRWAMPEWGWQPLESGTRITPQAAELHYQSGDRQLTITIAYVPFVGVVIAVVN